MIVFDNVSFSYGKKEILKDLSFRAEDGETLAVMGPSGVGKSTLLNLSAGLIHPTKGTVIKTNETLSYVFQEPRLFPWLNVFENVSSVLSMESATKTAVYQALEFVGLADSADKMPAELSGGMAARVSLARAIAADGSLLLLDEPFAALDKELKSNLMADLKQWMKKRNKTVLFVTHSKIDADFLADRILNL